MAPSPLTVIVGIKAGEEDALANIFTEIRLNLNSNPYVHFYKSPHTHFARWVIYDDPDRAKCKRVVFAAEYDGKLDSYLAELVSITPGLDAIWGKCLDYNGKSDFARFIKAHAYKPLAPFIAFRDETAATLKTYLALRQRFEAMLDTRNPNADQDTLLGLIARLPRNRSLFDKLLAPLNAVYKVVNEWLTKAADNSGGMIEKWFFGTKPAISQFSTASTDNCAKNIPIVPLDKTAGVELEDTFAQNQMNVLSDITPGKLARMKRVLFIVGLAAKISPPGILGGLSNIHFAHWTVIDGGKRLLFISNYDGSWENYIGSFVDRVYASLDAIWENCDGYNPGGARDIDAFREVIRLHQTPSNIFYSAYPDNTVLQLIKAREMGRELSKGFNPQAIEKWQEQV